MFLFHCTYYVEYYLIHSSCSIDHRVTSLNDVGDLQD